MSEKSLILLRGLPGSGKSTLASLLSDGGKHPAFSVDDYFTDELGKYDFHFEENHLAYKACEENTRKAMVAKTGRIIVHNVFSMEWEMETYFRLASEFGYSVFVATVENYHGSTNVHGINIVQLEKMAAKFKVKLM